MAMKSLQKWQLHMKLTATNLRPGESEPVEAFQLVRVKRQAQIRDELRLIRVFLRWLFRLFIIVKM